MKEIFLVIIIILVIGVGVYQFVTDLNNMFNHGKSIIKIKESKGLTIFWSVFLIFWIVMAWVNISEYVVYKNYREINIIILGVFWIEFSIANLIKSTRGTEIRENGIYNSGYFYKWSRIKSYKWISSNTIEFNIKPLLKVKGNFEIVVKEDFKLKIEGILHERII